MDTPDQPTENAEQPSGTAADRLRGAVLTSPQDLVEISAALHALRRAHEDAYRSLRATFERAAARELPDLSEDAQGMTCAIVVDATLDKAYADWR